MATRIHAAGIRRGGLADSPQYRDGRIQPRELADRDPPSEPVEHLRELHADYYGQTVGLLRPLPGATALMDAVAGLGLQVVLATSASEDELSTLRKVLGRDDIVSAVT